MTIKIGTFGLVFIGVTLCGISLAASPAAAQGNVDGQKYDKGATVTVQGCVVPGEGKDTYVFTGVKEWPIGNSPMGIYGPRHYWFDMDGPHDFSSFVGQTIQLKGPITELKALLKLKVEELIVVLKPCLGERPPR